MISLLFLVYSDRKIWAAVQMRRGPNVVGVWGLLQSVADALKYVLKEIVIPAGADKAVFILAPVLAFVPAVAVWAVVPFGEGFYIANLDVSLLYVMAIGSVGVYGIVLAGWASNSKYPLLGALRSTALLISYELVIGFVLVTGAILNIYFLLQTFETKISSVDPFLLIPAQILFFVSAYR